MAHKKILNAAIACALTAPGSAFATNGMNLDGYGPIARGMGGASMAYDNGAAAVMNNPATLGAMEEGSRLDVAVGFLGPNVGARVNQINHTTDSDGDAYWMPAIGWITKSGQLTYGAGVFAQGGMGTDYAANSPLALGSGDEVRSEIGVGRFIVPVVYSVNEQLSLAASLDFVWAGMDIKMAMDGGTLGGMMARGMGMDVPAGGEASGSLAAGMQQMGLSPDMVSWARFDFSNDNDFTGEAKGTGFAGKLGLMYQANSQLSFGLTYHSKTSLDDLDTDNGYMSMHIPGLSQMGMPSDTVKLKGKMIVKDFQWPSVWAAGMAYKVNNDLMLAADINHIRWADVMKDLQMRFVADSIPENGPFGGADLDAKMYQNWDNQTAFRVGAAYQLNDQLTLRGGINVAKNPIPDAYLMPIAPAIVRTHYAFGAGYSLNDAQEINFFFNYAPEVENTNNAAGITMTHSQINWSIMYSHRF